MVRPSLVVAITGASGAGYGLNLLGHLETEGVAVELLVSDAGADVLRREVDADRLWVRDGRPRLEDFGLSGDAVRGWGPREFDAPSASGTGRIRGMVIVPCSMGTLGRIAGGISSSLIERSADVCLKQRRPLVLVARETPLSRIHLDNMLRVTDAGAVVMPAAPGFYQRPESIEDLRDHLSGKILDVLGIEHSITPRWGDK